MGSLEAVPYRLASIAQASLTADSTVPLCERVRAWMHTQDPLRVSNVAPSCCKGSALASALPSKTRSVPLVVASDADLQASQTQSQAASSRVQSSPTSPGNASGTGDAGAQTGWPASLCNHAISGRTYICCPSSASLMLCARQSKPACVVEWSCTRSAGNAL